MCLDTVGKTVTLKKDKVVWKAVRVSDGQENPICKKKEYNFLSKRKHKSRLRTKCGETYIPHFHCFKTKENAAHYWGVCNNSAMKFIIPAGTKVLYGKQGTMIANSATVIVTPVLINPRVPE